MPDFQLQYARFWRRFGAFGIDFLIFLPLMGLSIWLGQKYRLYQLYLFLPNLFIGLFFYVYLVKQFGGTPGKLLLGIRIISVEGTAVSYQMAFLRHSVLFLLSIFISIGYILAALHMSDAEYFSLAFNVRMHRLRELTPWWFTPIDYLETVWIWSEFIVMFTNKHKRSIHDFIAGTVVIKKQSLSHQKA